MSDPQTSIDFLHDLEECDSFQPVLRQQFSVARVALETQAAEIEQLRKLVRPAIRIHDALLARNDNLMDSEFWELNAALNDLTDGALAIGQARPSESTKGSDDSGQIVPTDPHNPEFERSVLDAVPDGAGHLPTCQLVIDAGIQQVFGLRCTCGQSESEKMVAGRPAHDPREPEKSNEREPAIGAGDPGEIPPPARSPESEKSADECPRSPTGEHMEALLVPDGSCMYCDTPMTGKGVSVMENENAHLQAEFEADRDACYGSDESEQGCNDSWHTTTQRGPRCPVCYSTDKEPASRTMRNLPPGVHRCQHGYESDRVCPYCDEPEKH